MNNKDIDSIRKAIRDIPDFPRPGIVFKDITPLLGDGPLFAKTIDVLAERYRDQKIDMVLGIGASSSARRLPTSWAPASALFASRESCPTILTAPATSWNTVPIP